MPEDGGSFFHDVEITISEAGISGCVIQASAGVEASRYGSAGDLDELTPVTRPISHVVRRIQP